MFGDFLLRQVRPNAFFEPGQKSMSGGCSNERQHHACTRLDRHRPRTIEVSDNRRSVAPPNRQEAGTVCGTSEFKERISTHLNRVHARKCRKSQMQGERTQIIRSRGVLHNDAVIQQADQIVMDLARLVPGNL